MTSTGRVQEFADAGGPSATLADHTGFHGPRFGGGLPNRGDGEPCPDTPRTPIFLARLQQPI